MIDFERLGYKDITEDNPIRFSERLGAFFDSVHPYNKRYYKEDGYIKIVLTVGYDIAYDIQGTCYYPGGWMKFNFVEFEKDVINNLNKTLILVKDQISKNIERSLRYYGLQKEI